MRGGGKRWRKRTKGGGQGVEGDNGNRVRATYSSEMQLHISIPGKWSGKLTCIQEQYKLFLRKFYALALTVTFFVQ